MKKLFSMIGLFTGLAATGSAIEVGQPAPDLAIPSTAGRDISLADYRGQWVVLFFYPKAFTPGCTAQACSLRDEHQAIVEAGAVILGASVDNLRTQQRFKEEHNLPFELLADNDRELSRAMGVLALGGMITSRTTFLINPEGNVAHILRGVNVRNHDQDILPLLRGADESGS
ncbi:MAG TPA: peroxiredoxin [Kiritimatiellia bacterium]|nr:peroxiredoxin [Kiritimatiellia bacterium]